MNTIDVSAAKAAASNKMYCQIISKIINKHPKQEREMREHAIKIARKLADVSEDELEYFQFTYLYEMIFSFPDASEDIMDSCKKITEIHRKQARH
jgi:hypothetical protein